MKEIKAKERNVVNEKTLIVTVDIGKTTNTGYCRCPDKTEVKPFEFRNGYYGFQKFADVIFKTKDAKGLENVVVGFESTGTYAEPLIHFLKPKGVLMVQVNPLHMLAAARKSQKRQCCPPEICDLSTGMRGRHSYQKAESSLAA